MEQNPYFNLNDLLLRPDDPSKTYGTNKEQVMENYTPRWGQMKLFLSELWFLSQFGHPVRDRGSIVIYVGAAEGIHIPLLVQLFPWISEWHLYDPRPFAFNQPNRPNQSRPDWSRRIFLHTGDQGIFTNPIAAQWSEKLTRESRRAFFISDIRDLSMAKYNPQPGVNVEDDAVLYQDTIANNGILINDLRSQAEWYLILKPNLIKALLKFILPYPVQMKEWLQAGGGNDPNPYSIESRFTYLYGYVMKQPFSAKKSSETRLIPEDLPNGQPRFYDWSLVGYDNQMYYFKTEVRNNRVYAWPLEEIKLLMQRQFPDYRTYNRNIQTNGLAWDLAAVIYIYLVYLITHQIEPRSGLGPLHSAVMANLNISELDYPTSQQVYQVALQLYNTWKSTKRPILQKTIGRKNAHAKTGTTWDLTYAQSKSHPVAMELTPRDLIIQG